MNPWHEEVLENTREYHFKHLSIDGCLIDAVAEDWSNEIEGFKLPDWRMEVHYPFDNDNYIQFLVVTSAINAYYKKSGSKEKFWTIWRGKRYEGSMAMSACVMRAIEIGKPILDPHYLAAISLKEMADIFYWDSEIPVLEKRAAIWRSLGNSLLKKYDGHFKNLFKMSDYRCFDRGRGICERLAKDFPEAFIDVRHLEGKTFPIYKKALLVPLLYHGRASSSEVLRPLRDPFSISPVADYQLPKILESMLIFYYSDSLKIKIENGEELLSGSSEETEIRVATIVATSSLLSKINDWLVCMGKDKITMPHLDYRLWKKGRELLKAHHITKTLDY